MPIVNLTLDHQSVLYFEKLLCEIHLKARELDYSEWRQERKEFITSRAQMVSTYLTGTLSQSSLDRVKDTRETDMEEAIRESDILAVHKIVWDSHQYRGKTFKVADTGSTACPKRIYYV